jgi:AcrR family transcriptional regulator
MSEGAPRKRVRLDYDERRQLILGAARRLFCERPYSEVSMADLAGEAGVARGLLHHYFGSKRDLYLEVTRQLIRLPTMPLPTPDPAEAITAWEASVDGWMHLIDANRELWITMLGVGAAGRDLELQEIIDAGKEHTAGLALEALGVEPTTAPPEVWAIVRGYGGLVEETIREWLQRGRLSRAQAREVLFTTLPLLVDQLLPLLLEQTGDDRPADASDSAADLRSVGSDGLRARRSARRVPS